MIANPSFVTEDMISVYDLVKDISLEPSLLDKIGIDVLQLHRCYEMFIWGLEMQVLRLPKVLAVGQTSGSGGWVQKLVFVLTKAMGLSSVGGNPKKQ